MSRSVDDFLAELPRFTAVNVVGADGHVYGVQTSQVTITTASTQILQTNSRRVSWTICNLGTDNVFVAWAPGVSTSSGYPIFSSGGVLETSVIDDKNIAQQELFGIAAVGSTVAVVQVVRVD